MQKMKCENLNAKNEMQKMKCKNLNADAPEALTQT